MSKVCDICSKKRVSGNNVSHSNRKTKRTFLPNLQKMTITSGGVKKNLKVCSRCIRTLGKTQVK